MGQLKYFIYKAIEVGGKWDITNAVLFTDDGDTETILQSGFNYVTAGGWKSKKRVVEPLEVLSEEDGLLIISEACAKTIIKFSGGNIYRPGFYVEPLTIQEIEMGFNKPPGLRIF